MDFVRPMLTTPVRHSAEIAYDFIDTVTARVEAGRNYNRMLMGRAYRHDGFRLYSPQDWMTLLLIWETLQARTGEDPRPAMEPAPFGPARQIPKTDGISDMERVLHMGARVLLADDAAVVRKVIRCILLSEPEIELVGEAEDFTETLALTRQLEPQVIILDPHMPDSRPTPVTMGELCSCNASIIAISVWYDEDTKALARSYGAEILLDKMKLGNELIPAILKTVSQRARSKTAVSKRKF